MFEEGDEVEVLITLPDLGVRWADGFIVIAKVAAVDRISDFRYDVRHNNGTVFREIAHGCVRPQEKRICESNG